MKSTETMKGGTEGKVIRMIEEEIEMMTEGSLKRDMNITSSETVMMNFEENEEKGKK